MIRRKKGITLIALIITIIVLLILAGITVGILTSDGGILDQGKNAKKETETSTELEKVRLSVHDAVINASRTVNGLLNTEFVTNGIKGEFGLGLSIVKKTLNIMDYDITIQNEKKGVSFIIAKYKGTK